jgi:hypothetical protein
MTGEFRRVRRPSPTKPIAAGGGRSMKVASAAAAITAVAS